MVDNRCKGAAQDRGLVTVNNRTENRRDDTFTDVDKDRHKGRFTTEYTRDIDADTAAMFARICREICQGVHLLELSQRGRRVRATEIYLTTHPSAHSTEVFSKLLAIALRARASSFENA